MGYTAKNCKQQYSVAGLKNVLLHESIASSGQRLSNQKISFGERCKRALSGMKYLSGQAAFYSHP